MMNTVTPYVPRAQAANDPLTIVYVSEEEPRLMAWRGEQWLIFPTENASQALALSVFYTPHAVIIDGNAPWLDEVMLDLLHVTGPSARGRDVIVRVGGELFTPDVPNFIEFVRVPADITPDALAHAVRAAVQGARLPKVVA